MADYRMENNQIQAAVSSKGCELISVVRKSDKRAYLWGGRPEIWKRHAPVLFPLVGRYRGDSVKHQGKQYVMKQHGFARDMEFELISHTETEVSMRLVSTPETLLAYPFHFVLVITHRLCENRIVSSWRVENPNSETMYFSIGGHPAFICGHEDVSMADCTLSVNSYQPVLRYRLLNDSGLVTGDIYGLALGENGRIQLSNDFFDRDAYIIEQNQSHCVSIEQNGEPFVTVRFDAPVFGLWAPPNQGVPFVCIEPWYGRSDSSTFEGELKDREWGNPLKAGSVFEAGYEMKFS